MFWLFLLQQILFICLSRLPNLILQAKLLGGEVPGEPYDEKSFSS